MFVWAMWEPAPTPKLVIGSGKEHYRTLNIRSGANSEEIRFSYRRLAKQLHPDKVPPEKKEWAAKEFNKLQKAYDVMKDEKLRWIYDGCGDIGLVAWDSRHCQDDWQTCCSQVTKIVDAELAKMAKNPQYYQRRQSYDEFETYDHYYRYEF